MRSIAIALTLMFVATLVDLGPAEARRTNRESWTGNAQNPWAFTNCFIYSGKIKWYVWICGKPYPDGFATPDDVR